MWHFGHDRSVSQDAHLIVFILYSSSNTCTYQVRSLSSCPIPPYLLSLSSISTESFETLITRFRNPAQQTITTPPVPAATTNYDTPCLSLYLTVPSFQPHLPPLSRRPSLVFYTSPISPPSELLTTCYCSHAIQQADL
jgi:hypothetical protein